MKEKVYRSKYEAYPFLSDPSDQYMCDFEIFTDEISAQIGLLRSLVPDKFLQEELLLLCELVYHINPSLRTFVSVTPEELLWLENCTQRLREETLTRCDKFILNQGCQSACVSHIIRTMFKRLVRMIYRHIYAGNQVPDILLDFANLLSGYFFFLSMKLNDMEQVEEVEFISKNYK